VFDSVAVARGGHHASVTSKQLACAHGLLAPRGERRLERHSPVGEMQPCVCTPRPATFDVWREELQTSTLCSNSVAGPQRWTPSVSPPKQSCSSTGYRRPATGGGWNDHALALCTCSCVRNACRNDCTTPRVGAAGLALPDEQCCNSPR